MVIQGLIDCVRILSPMDGPWLGCPHLVISSKVNNLLPLILGELNNTELYTALYSPLLRHWR